MTKINQNWHFRKKNNVVEEKIIGSDEYLFWSIKLKLKSDDITKLEGYDQIKTL